MDAHGEFLLNLTGAQAERGARINQNRYTPAMNLVSSFPNCCAHLSAWHIAFLLLIAPCI
jgi:hypothetical protein